MQKTVNRPLQTSRHNFFSLVVDPSQPSFDLDCCTQSIAEPFESGFLGYTGLQIRSFINDCLPTDLSTNIEPCQYAILDHRSAED